MDLNVTMVFYTIFLITCVFFLVARGTMSSAGYHHLQLLLMFQ